MAIRYRTHGDTVTTLRAMVAEDDWRRLTAGDGAKGLRWYDWPWRPLAAPQQPGWWRWLVVRRGLSAPTERTAYVVHAPATTTLATVVPVIGPSMDHRTMLCGGQRGGGLDQYEVRHGTGWDRPITLAMWAYALVTVLRAAHASVPLPEKNLLGCHA